MTLALVRPEGRAGAPGQCPPGKFGLLCECGLPGCVAVLHVTVVEARKLAARRRNSLEPLLMSPDHAPRVGGTVVDGWHGWELVKIRGRKRRL